MAFPNRLYGVMGNQNLLAVPLFIFMGLVLEKTKIAESLIQDMNSLFNETDSGLAISVVIVGALMAASTGIVGASVVTLGLLTYPVLVKNGYPASVASGTICSWDTRTNYPAVFSFDIISRRIIFIISASSIKYGNI